MARSKSRISHVKEVYYILCIVAVLVVLLFSFFGPGGYRDLRKLQIEVQEKHTRVDRLERENSERLKSIEKLNSDKNALEKYAREKGYGRPGDIIQQLPKPEKR
jgi:cell division protein FtsB